MPLFFPLSNMFANLHTMSVLAWCWFNSELNQNVPFSHSLLGFLYFLICCLIQILLRWIELRWGEKNYWFSFIFLNPDSATEKAGLFSPHSFLRIIPRESYARKKSNHRGSGFQKDLLSQGRNLEGWVTCLDDSLLLEVYLNKAHITSWFVCLFFLRIITWPQEILSFLQ